MISADGTHHSVSGTVSISSAVLDLGNLPGTSTCYSFQLYINTFLSDAQGNLVAFSGTLGGRCCGTVAGTFRFERQPGT
jgi:hypothetical protein